MYFDISLYYAFILNNISHIGWKVEFRLGASLLGKRLDVFINHPLSSDGKFERQTYYQLQWVDESASIHLTLSGSFHYYVSDQ